jgi:hypothetical protein
MQAVQAMDPDDGSDLLGGNTLPLVRTEGRGWFTTIALILIGVGASFILFKFYARPKYLEYRERNYRKYAVFQCGVYTSNCYLIGKSDANMAFQTTTMMCLMWPTHALFAESRRRRKNNESFKRVHKSQLPLLLQVVQGNPFSLRKVRRSSTVNLRTFVLFSSL